MIPRHELQTLRQDNLPQRVAQDAMHKAMAAWRASAQAAEVLAGLEQFAQGGDLAEADALAQLFAARGEAGFDFAQGFVRHMAAALDAEPLGHLALRHFTDGTHSTLLVGRCGGTTLSLSAIDGQGFAALPQPRAASFSAVESHELVLAGQACGDLIELGRCDADEARLVRRPMALDSRSLLVRNGTRETLLLREVTGCLVSLRLQRRLADAHVVHEYDLASGRQVHQAAAQPQDSRIEMKLALLGRMGRSDAAPQMAALALGNEASDALRWQALRECLALDTREGFAALEQVAQHRGDPLSHSARALVAQLLEAHPQLAGLTLCPA